MALSAELSRLSVLLVGEMKPVTGSGESSCSGIGLSGLFPGWWGSGGVKFSIKRVNRWDSGGDKDNKLAAFRSRLAEHMFPLVRLRV
jgi:hypothetical protein